MSDLEGMYALTDLPLRNFFEETESQEYEACSFELGPYSIKYRKAKITPTKVGQFVTFWKRNGKGPILPYDGEDPFDFFIVGTHTHMHSGQFIFPKRLLLEKKILSQNGKGGKRAIRIYPPWDVTTSSQAKQTQKWQFPYFFKLPFKPDFGKNLLSKL